MFHIGSLLPSTERPIAPLSSCDRGEYENRVAPAAQSVPSAVRLFFTLPFDAAQTIQDLNRSHRQYDVEGKIHGALRACALPLDITASSGMLANILSMVRVIPKAPIVQFLTATPILSSIVCVFSFTLEMLGLYNVHAIEEESNLKALKALIENPPTNKEEKQNAILQIRAHYAENSDTYIEQLGQQHFDLIFNSVEAHIAMLSDETVDSSYDELYTLALATTALYLQTHFFELGHSEIEKLSLTASSVDDAAKKALHQVNGKKSRLARRTSNWLVEELRKALPSAIDKLQSHDSATIAQGVKEAETIVNKLHMQTTKKRIVYVIGIISLALIVGGLSASTMGAPLIAVAALYTAATIVSLTQYFLDKGWVNSHDWSFDCKAITPGFILRRLQSKETAQPIHSRKIALDRSARSHRLSKRSRAHIHKPVVFKRINTFDQHAHRKAGFRAQRMRPLRTPSQTGAKPAG